MNRDVVDQLIENHPLYADIGLLALPNGWHDIVRDLFCDLTAIQAMSPGFKDVDLPILMVCLDWKSYPSDRHIVYVCPHLHHRHWTNEMALRLIQVVSRFNTTAEQVCEVCGHASVGVLKYQDDRRQERLCEQHMAERKWL
ncbi:hypothetical protein [uncultured Agrobacterium sp.]|uniref:hypothetical protein n=1 Tax=uncultured Agrobacterium sp. TaxID=157277 RepID=UPI0025848FB6|nr:hypothetical protein [uncultured Agrobacterium sp.]